MKRSRHITLVSVLSMGVALAACSEQQAQNPNNPLPDNDTLYSDLNACKRVYSEEDCKTYELYAHTEHEKTAPRYAGASAAQTCEQQHGVGKCTEKRDSQGNSFFMPFMMGYLMGGGSNPVAGGTPRSVYGGSGPSGFVSNGKAVTSYQQPPNSPGGGGGGAAAFTSAPRSTAPAAAPSSSTSSTSRGGFGGTASSGMSAGS